MITRDTFASDTSCVHACDCSRQQGHFHETHGHPCEQTLSIRPVSRHELHTACLLRQRSDVRRRDA